MKRYALALIGLLDGVLGVPAPDALIPTTAAGGDPVVRMATSLGNIDIELDPASAPATVKNFMKYVEDGFYDGLIEFGGDNVSGQAFTYAFSNIDRRGALLKFFLCSVW